MKYSPLRSSSGSAELAGLALFDGARPAASGSRARSGFAPQPPAPTAASRYAVTVQPWKSTGSRRVQKFIGSLYPVAHDILSPFLRLGSTDLLAAATQLHRAILAHADDPDHLDDMLSSPRLQDLPDALAIALLRGTFSFRPALKHWIEARDTIRDRMQDQGTSVETVLRGLL